jgi:hypothetical protein
MAHVKILKEAQIGEEGNWKLCFQWVQYNYDDASPQKGYRFIWRRPDGSLQASRGQARIPSASNMFTLISKASAEGWFIKVEDEE